MDSLDFKPDISMEMRERIGNVLAELEERENVQIIFAIESGSRAWGFPSPDSDYDVRFVYARPRDWYLSIFPGRDVIELPIDAVLDVGGWDIKKALGLLLKPNPVLLEWLSSPVRYRWNEEICTTLSDLARQTTYGTACRYHYLNVCESKWNKWFNESDSVKLKPYFYALRPALALRWLRMRPTEPPPMNVAHLLNGIDVSKDLRSALHNLLMQKSKSNERAYGRRVAEIDTLISEEIAEARAVNPEKAIIANGLQEQAEALFRDIITNATPRRKQA